jgi:hypothetical protein
MKRNRYEDEDGNFDVEAYTDACDRAYDARCDDIICSKDFRECTELTEESICKIEKYKCWHVKKCPLGKERI